MIIKLKLKISGMHCTSCAMSIDGDLEDYVKGVKSSNTNYAKGQTEVTFEDKETNINFIIAQIKKTGYLASVEK